MKIEFFAMYEHVKPIAGIFLSMEEDLKQDFEKRIAETSTLAFRVAYAVLRNAHDAEDVAQEAFAKAYRRFGQLRDRDRFRAWLVRMTWRMAINRTRSERRRTIRETAADLTPAGTSSPVQHVIERERAEKLWQAIDALPEKLRIVIVMAGIEEHDVRDIATLLRLPEGPVKSRLFLARKRLKESLR
jgi:RNA polymerase sigma-70 factor (ECF subfamily)